MRLLLWAVLLPLAAGSRQRGRCLHGSELWVKQHPLRAIRQEGACLDMSCTVDPPPLPGALMASWHRRGLVTKLGRAWLENGSTSVLSLRGLRDNDSGIYCCRLIVLLSGQPCLLWGPGTHLVVTGPSAQNMSRPGPQGNASLSEPGTRTLPPHHWTIRLLVLGAGIVLAAAFVLCLHWRQRGKNQE